MNSSISVLLVGILSVLPQLASTDPCQNLKCQPLTEICRRNSSCSPSNSTSCYSCVRKSVLSSPTSYDDYYEYDDDDDDDAQQLEEKLDLNEYHDYLDDYAESFDRSKPVRKLGTCPSPVDAGSTCNRSQIVQPTCRLDSDCPGDLKCCAAPCEKRTCAKPVQVPLTNCPQTFHCSLNCRLGYRVDANGCLLCECQSCPSMERCTKSCPAGYLKDLFNCDMCECRDACPPFVCRLICPSNVGFAQSEAGCPLCQCATSLAQAVPSNASCEKDVHCPTGFRCVTDARHVPMCQAVDRDRVNWFVYDFELKTTLLTDEKFLSTFKSGLIHNIAKKYNLKSSQIAVSSVEPAGLTSFQVMPYYDEDLEEFQTKIDQIDSDLNSHAFRAVLPAIVDAIGEDSTGSSTSVLERVRCRWNRFPALRRRLFVCTIAFLFTVSGVVLLVLLVKLVVKKRKYAKLDECQSKISAENEDDKEALVTEKGEPPIRAV